MMSYQDFLALNYLKVDHQVLQEEFNISKKKSIEFVQDK